MVLPVSINPHYDVAVSASQQYFSVEPSSEENRRNIELSLAGLPFQIQTASGVFSSHGLDKGTEVLLRKVPDLPAAGTFVDVGCGWGSLALVMACKRPDARVIAVDVNPRALELTEQNAAENGLHNVVVVDAKDTAAVIPPASVDVIWSNPPIRIGKTGLHEMWQDWRGYLKPSGVAYLVVGKNLGADTFLKWLNANGWQARKIASSKGFRVLQLQIQIPLSNLDS